MAWVTEYDLKWTDWGYGTGAILIQRDGGSYQQGLKLVKGSLEIRKLLPDYDESVVRMSCSFAIQNDLSDFFELLPLMTISNGQLRVVVTKTNPVPSGTLFIGYLNCETIQQPMLWNQPIRFTASGLINKLQYDYPDSVDIRQNVSLIDILDDCLVMTGDTYPIRVRCRLEEVNSPLSAAQTLFNRTGVFTELFWENNIERMSALEIIEAILETFNCYLYWYEEYWYIVHYTELADSAGYVEYTSGTSAGYQYDDSGSWSNAAYTTTLLHYGGRPQANTSQLLSISPGLAKIDIKLNQLQFWNLLNGDLSNPTINDVSQDRSYPGFRKWHAYKAGSSPYDWESDGEPYKNISNSISRRGGYDCTTGDAYLNGLTTMFKMSLQEDTELTIKFKFAVRWAHGAPHYTFFRAPEETEITFSWFLRFGAAAYAVLGDSSGEWSSSLFMTANHLVITGADLDQDRWSYEGELVIPIGEVVYDLLGSSAANEQELDMTFRMGTENFEDTSDAAAWDEPGSDVVYGDFSATITETPDSNLLQGTLNTDFLDKKEIELVMFDTGWSYRNALLRGTDFLFLTEDWGLDSVFDTIARRLLQEKFRLYNVARQRIGLEYITYDFFRPLLGFYDDKQSNKEFIMLEDVHRPENRIHKVLLWEYDNDTEINLI